ncbi:MAG: metallophosphoesterase family protein [Candidatus Cloacimonetes bacterium]|nr:metallophosphoesterase family protein [Candidatus Cloacimonadota bacterium]
MALLEQALRRESDCEYIFHLGDNYEDMDKFPALVAGKTVIRVPGIFHAGYRDGSLAKVQRVEIGGWRFLLTHDVQDVSSLEEVDIILHGHTHYADCVKVQDVYLLNPGHLKSAKDRGYNASYAVVRADDNQLKINFLSAAGVTFRTEQVV